MYCYAVTGTTTPTCVTMYATSSFASTFNGASADTGYIVGVVVSVTVMGLIALMGLGFGIRHLKKIIGRKF